jgi:hypothetical protein
MGHFSVVGLRTLAQLHVAEGAAHDGFQAPLTAAAARRRCRLGWRAAAG